MKKTGFTLVELLAVIIVLAIILAVTVPAIFNITRSASKASFESDAKMVLKAVDYKKLESDNFDPTTVTKDNVSALLGLSNKNYESVTIAVKDNVTVINIAGVGKWKGLVACGTYKNMQVVESFGSCSSDVIPPVITVLGDNPVLIQAGESYTDAGATATDNKDGNITSSIVTTGLVNPNVSGTYTITYTVTDAAGNETTATRTISVVDDQAPIITLLGTTPVTIAQGSTYSDAGATAIDTADGNLTSSIVTTGTVNVNTLGTYTITYDASDSSGNAAITVTRIVIVELSDYNVEKGVNRPVLAVGMTPIKWNGTDWINTTENDTGWYNYSATDKRWANAKTADGSMWVWIPRYIYKISSGWHVNTTGTIDVQFSKGIDDNWNRISVGDINTDTTANASNNTWTNHPSFIFGSTELMGIWVAKFEPTASEGVVNGYMADSSCPTTGDNVTTKTIKILPNVQSWRCISIGNAFTATRNMEVNSAYGWATASTLKSDGTFTTDTNNIDTHLMKNAEWGAVAYLSKSQYGKNTEIYINNSQNYITGCAGNTATAVGYDGCQNTYETTGGVKASTTGNIYGIYDLSGSAWEDVSAYVNNGNSNLSTYGSSIVNATSKYKDLYQKSTTDTNANNYPLTINQKGDAVYETSNNIGAYSWFSDYSYMPNNGNPWFIRGGHWNYGSAAGAFSFNITYGYTYSYIGFRPILLVGDGL